MMKTMKKTVTALMCCIMLGACAILAGTYPFPALGREESAKTGEAAANEPSAPVDTVNLTDPEYTHLIGRTYYDETQKATFMNFSASGFEVKFYGTKLTAYFVGSNLNSAVNRPYITVTTDKDTDPDRAQVIAIRNEGETVIADGLIAGYHTVRVYKRSESTSSFLGVKYVKTDGRMVKPDPEEYDYQIEFFGDSITCGYGVDGKAYDEDFNTHDENALHTYAYYTARALNAKASFVSAGGFPLYRSLYSLDAPIDNIPDLIDKSHVTFAADVENPTYNVKANPKDIVVINLGANDSSIANFIIGMMYDDEYTNDQVASMLEHINNNLIAQSSAKMSAFWALPAAQREAALTKVRATAVYGGFINGFKDKLDTFITDLRKIYPGVKIVCSTGMIDFTYDLIAATDEITRKHSEYAFRFKFNSLSVGGILPGRGHPNHEMHKFAGKELTQFIKNTVLA